MINLYTPLRPIASYLPKESMENAYKTLALSKTQLSEIKAQWGTLAEPEVFSIELGPFFQWATGVNESEVSFIGVQDEVSGRFLAIVELIHGTQRGRVLTKLMKIVLSPSMWGSNVDYFQLSCIYVESVMSAIGIGTENGIMRSKDFSVKIYGRSEELFGLLLKVYKSMTELFTEKKHSFLEVSMHGRWLVVSQNLGDNNEDQQNN